jgi:hypothetical protein
VNSKLADDNFELHLCDYSKIQSEKGHIVPPFTINQILIRVIRPENHLNVIDREKLSNAFKVLDFQWEILSPDSLSTDQSPFNLGSRRTGTIACDVCSIDEISHSFQFAPFSNFSVHFDNINSKEISHHRDTLVSVKYQSFHKLVAVIEPILPDLTTMTQLKHIPTHIEVAIIVATDKNCATLLHNLVTSEGSICAGLATDVVISGSVRRKYPIPSANSNSAEIRHVINLCFTQMGSYFVFALGRFCSTSEEISDFPYHVGNWWIVPDSLKVIAVENVN